MSGGADLVAMQIDPLGVVNPLPKACLMRVKGWLLVS
jgi:hypothetical protein